jgi:hypothetical protein
MRRRLLLLWLAVPLLAGCRNQSDSGEELSYVRTNPQEYEAPLIDARKLMPLKPGMRWEYGVQRSKGDPTREISTVTSFNGKRAIIEGQERGVVISRDGYLIDEKGIWITSVISGNASIPVTPPLPFLPLPIEEGKVVTWQGTIGSGQTTLIGRAWTRVTRRQKIKTLAGEFMTYRVDMRTDTGRAERGDALLVSRWFAPGVGVVRVRAFGSQSSIVKELLPQKKGNSSVTSGVK